MSKVANFNLLGLHLAPLLRMTPFEYWRDLWHQKTRVPGLLCGVVCMILHFTVSVEHRLVTDRQTHDYAYTTQAWRCTVIITWWKMLCIN